MPRKKLVNFADKICNAPDKICKYITRNCDSPYPICCNFNKKLFTHSGGFLGGLVRLEECINTKSYENRLNQPLANESVEVVIHMRRHYEKRRIGVSCF